MLDTDERLSAIEETCRVITDQVDRSYLAACGRANERPDALYSAAATSGLMSIGLDEGYGGSGGGLAELTYATDLLGRAGLMLPQMLLNNMCRTTIARHGTDAQRAALLPGTVTGDLAFSFAITEADSGTNTFGIRTRADRTRDGSYRINGSKLYITGFAESDVCLLVARTAAFDPEHRSAGVSILLVDPRADGVTATPMDIGMYYPERNYVVSLDDVIVAEDSLIGAEGGGLAAVFDTLNPERLLVAAQNVGLGDYLIDKAAAYARVRAPFETPIGAYQSVQHPLAQAKAMIEAARALIERTAQRLDDGRPIKVDASTSKLLASQAFKAAAEAATTAFGGAFADLSQDLIPYFLLAKLNEIAPVNNATILNLIAEKSLHLPRSY